MTLLDATIKRIGRQASLIKIGEGDHSFHVLKRFGGTDAQVLAEKLDDLVRWMAVMASPMSAA